jgi:hypothetical protein
MTARCPTCHAPIRDSSYVALIDGVPHPVVDRRCPACPRSRLERVVVAACVGAITWAAALVLWGRKRR